MEFVSGHKGRTAEITDLFAASFTASEGADEGQTIAALVRALLTTVEEEDLFVFSVLEGGAVVASILFTRMRYDQDDRVVFLLSPVAVAPDQQGKGTGQALLRHGLSLLKRHGVDIILTYGDVNFYAKVGFRQITEQEAAAPMPLSYPHGWLGQSLTGGAFAPLVGPASCAAPFRNQEYW
ncbi:N-acetyltransferase [Phaeobacter sp. CAU 1743]|uniref:GNAT family N-acetyltransferase n=1 Tax=Phaeobacter sp. CAU 1743 TaxID=3140367 RepID=UPI0023B647FA